MWSPNLVRIPIVCYVYLRSVKNNYLIPRKRPVSLYSGRLICIQFKNSNLKMLFEVHFFLTSSSPQLFCKNFNTDFWPSALALALRVNPSWILENPFAFHEISNQMLRSTGFDPTLSVTTPGIGIEYTIRLDRWCPRLRL